MVFGMAWQTVQRGRRQGVGIAAGEARPEFVQLAQELRAAIMPKPRIGRGSGTSVERRPEWICATCQMSIFMNCRCCRWCAAAAPTDLAVVHQGVAAGEIHISLGLVDCEEVLCSCDCGQNCGAKAALPLQF